jgi:2-amino-4-hydroxy-6-hydroxymethyldihydropteridine diphosphokinase
MSSVALIGLGSNLGDRKAALEGAIAVLSEAPGIVVRKVSSFHETEPVGGPAGQGRYLNAAAALETTLEPIELLHVLQQIETRFGRVRTVRWDERTLDLDLLLFGDRVIETPELVVPHPRFSARRFVLEPLAEVAPEAVDPVTRRTIAQLLADLDRTEGSSDRSSPPLVARKAPPYLKDDLESPGGAAVLWLRTAALPGREEPARTAS